MGIDIDVDTVDTDSLGTYNSDEAEMQGEMEISDAKSDLSDEKRTKEYLTETVYTDESCEEITFGDISVTSTSIII